MTRFFIILILLTVCFFQSVEAYVDIEEVREKFHLISDEEDISELIQLISSESSVKNQNTLNAYKGACISMTAEYKFSPISKIVNFNKGTEMIEASIQKEANVENIYLRLLVQLSVPKLLGYHENISTDIDFLILELPSSLLDIEYKNKMITILLNMKNREIELKKLKSVYFE